jgi:hypothetical protein
VLVVYRLEEYPLRGSVADHLSSFRRYSDSRCFYLNLGLRQVPRFIGKVQFDLVVYHTSFLSARWAPGLLEALMERARPLKGLGRARVALPQDEFFRTDILEEFIEEFEVDTVLSVAPPSEWEKIYPKTDRSRVRFGQVLTGYLDEGTVDRTGRVLADGEQRPIDIGYRAWHAVPWLGRHGLLKTRIEEAFADAAPARGLKVDISTRHEDTLLGDDWLRFLGSCKYTIGVEGGATILDADGSLKQRTEAYMAANPGADFGEIEQSCFRGRDGELQLKVISPRHLEACATRTCQILVEGDYSGILRPGEHYIELKADFSNLDEVLDTAVRDDRREGIAAAAHRDVVASGDWTYARLVADVESATGIRSGAAGAASSPRDALWCTVTNALDRVSVLRQRFRLGILAPLRGAAKRMLRR